MHPSLVDKLCCPFDKQDLELKIVIKDLGGNIVEGMLTCQHCRRYYPIVYGVPILSPDEYRQPQLEAPIVARWERALDGAYVKDFRLIEGGKNE